MNDWPMGCHLTTGTAELCILGTSSLLRVRVFHRKMEPSVEPHAMYCPSGLKEQRVCSPMRSPSAVNVAIACLNFRSMNFIVDASCKKHTLKTNNNVRGHKHKIINSCMLKNWTSHNMIKKKRIEDIYTTLQLQAKNFPHPLRSRLVIRPSRSISKDEVSCRSSQNRNLLSKWPLTMSVLWIASLV